MKRALAALLVVSFAFAAAAPLLAAEGGSEDRLRRRVKRFYVLNYLNRYGEMWEMFSADLRARLGDDRRAYVQDARRSGFELCVDQAQVFTDRRPQIRVVVRTKFVVSEIPMFGREYGCQSFDARAEGNHVHVWKPGIGQNNFSTDIIKQYHYIFTGGSHVGFHPLSLQVNTQSFCMTGFFVYDEYFIRHEWFHSLW